MPGKALFAGATGLVGSHLLDLILEKGDYDRVVSFVRHPSGKSHQVLRERLVAFKDLDSVILKDDVDDIYCCLGTTMKKAGSKKNFIQVDFDYPLKLAEIGLKHGAKRMFVISSLGADRKSLFFYSRVKGKMEMGLSKLPFETLGIFRPALILGERNEWTRSVIEGLNAGTAKTNTPKTLPAKTAPKQQPVKQPVKKPIAQPKFSSNETFSYDYRPDAVYRVADSGDWYINAGKDTHNEFIKLNDPTGKRTETLRKFAHINEVPLDEILNRINNSGNYDSRTDLGYVPGQ